MPTIEIMPTADHQNVPPDPRAKPPMPLGWSRGRVPIEAQRKGSPVACTPGVVGLVLTISGMRHRDRDGWSWENGEQGGAALFVTIEQLVNGVWVPLHAFAPMRDPLTQCATALAMGEQLRASWYFARNPYVPGTYTAQVAITWGLTIETPDLPA